MFVFLAGQILDPSGIFKQLGDAVEKKDQTEHKPEFKHKHDDRRL